MGNKEKEKVASRMTALAFSKSKTKLQHVCICLSTCSVCISIYQRLIFYAAVNALN